MLDPFPDIPLSDDVEELSTWLAEERSISSHELWCLLKQTERSRRLLDRLGEPIPAKVYRAMRLIKTALRKRSEARGEE